MEGGGGRFWTSAIYGVFDYFLYIHAWARGLLELGEEVDESYFYKIGPIHRKAYIMWVVPELLLGVGFRLFIPKLLNKLNSHVGSEPVCTGLKTSGYQN